MRFRAIPSICLSLVLLLVLHDSIAQDTAPSEYRIKSAFLFNFAKFVEWPEASFADKRSPFVIGILGDNPFGEDLQATIRGKLVNDRTFEIRELKASADLKQCHILFISASEKAKVAEIILSLNKASILTVSETDQFTDHGGMIHFVIVENKVRFRINDDAAKAASLKISSKLLSLALH